MNNELKYSGYTAVPSDYECPDGSLAAALNIISEDNQLKPIFQPKVMITLGEYYRIIIIHEISPTQKHYIILNEHTNNLYWMDSTASFSEDDNHKIGHVSSVGNITVVGNTLVVLTDGAINYFLWQNNKYIALGDHIPDISLSFGLRGRPRFYSISDENKNTFEITFDEIDEANIRNPWSQENKTRITAQIMAKVNKFLREQTINKGRFALPFFVRYALRLYDGSLVCHSAPILMNPSTHPAPIVFPTIHVKNHKCEKADCDIMLVAASLDYVVNNADNSIDAFALSDLQNKWSDIVKSVDVFISQPIYTYDQNGECTDFADSNNFQSRFIGRLAPKDRIFCGIDGYPSPEEDKVFAPFRVGMNHYATDQISAFDNFYAEWPYEILYQIYKNPVNGYPNNTIHLPEFDYDKVRESISNCANFYLLHSIDIKDLTTTDRQEIVVGDEYLQSLTNRERMTDDYLSHDTLHAQFAYTYNGRINLAGLKRKPFKGFNASSMFSYVNCNFINWTIRITEHEGFKNNETFVYHEANWSATGDRNSQCKTHITVYIRENGKEYTVKTIDSQFTARFLSGLFSSEGGQPRLFKRNWGAYLFYPNVNAYKMVICDDPDSGEGYEINLKPHEFLNGAFALLDYDLQRASNCLVNTELEGVSGSDNDEYIDVPNKIYTSEINNPFYFPLLGINTVGTGTILGISTAAKALSQGQFGQFPLYAFTSEGVWALEVSSSGSYTARQPITRDVILPNTIPLQMDSAVLFATNRGIMQISGSNTTCISEMINSEKPFDLSELPGMEKLHDSLDHTEDSCFPIDSFFEFIKECGMLYDYIHQRVIVYNKRYSYAYVFSLKSQQWGMMHSNIKAGINSYPEALAVDHNGCLLNFSSNDTIPQKGLAVTRPIKLLGEGVNGDMLKTIDTVIQRGNFACGHVQTVLYGSRDLKNWFVVWSSKDHYLRGFRGTGYKYFRIALVTSMTEGESIFGASINFNPRQTNQLR